MKPVIREIINFKRELKPGYHLLVYMRDDINFIITKDDKIIIKDNESYFILDDNSKKRIVFLNNIVLITEQQDKDYF